MILKQLLFLVLASTAMAATQYKPMGEIQIGGEVSAGGRRDTGDAVARIECATGQFLDPAFIHAPGALDG